MPEIFLNGPAVINGAVRYPVEGAIPVTDEQAETLLANGQIDEEKTFADAEDKHQDGDILDGLKVDELKKLASDEEIDLGDATKKDDIIAAIRAHRAAAK